jgi:alpha-beta hydrolase superfamily lysophospholipase
MEIIRKEYLYPSVTGVADIFARSWAPAGTEIKAVLQMVHGMAEYGERYEDFAKAMCEAGYAFIVNDHVGHGKSVKNEKDLGYFGGDKNKGGIGFVEDAHTLTNMAKEEFGKPVILMGHSMGSFIVRKYVTQYASDISGLIICGTSGSNPGAAAGITLANIVMKLKGERYPSKLIDKIAFGSYNKRFPGRTTFDWLSRDNENVDKYVADSGCGFLFTASGYKNMFELLQSVSTDDWYKKVPTDLPMFVISGEQDPVGNYTQGVKEVCDKLKSTGHNKLSNKFYKDCRHEILNELNRKEVYADIISWCNDLM